MQVLRDLATDAVKGILAEYVISSDRELSAVITSRRKAAAENGDDLLVAIYDVASTEVIGAKKLKDLQEELQ